MLTGSMARNNGLADHMSDIDVEVVSTNPATLECDDRWLHDLGELTLVMRLNPGDGQEWATRLAIYADGVRVDYTLAGPSRLQRMAESGTLNKLYDRGYKILVDKDGIAKGLRAPTGSASALPLPTQPDFTAAVEEFWFEASHIPKYLARGELWLVKFRDWAMKECLLRMVQWHAIAIAPSVDVWHNGQNMARWLEPEAWEELQLCFGRFDAADARRAFAATTALYARLGREVALEAGLEYPRACEQQISAINDGILQRL